jgi:hypothetical protein
MSEPDRAYLKWATDHAIEMAESQPPPPPPLTDAEIAAMPVTVRPEPGSRLESLADRYERIKDKTQEDAAELDDVVKAIKAELANAAPGKTNILLDSPLLSVPLRMLGVVSRRMNVRALQKDYPQVYRDYSSESTSWRLERYKG